MSDKWCYDALNVRNHTAFFNHSTNPNVECFEYYDKEGPHIVFYACRMIPQGEELMLDYGKDYVWRNERV